MKALLKKRKGFTIVELLIVVAIIGILATIVIVSLKEASDRARNTKIITSVTQIRKIAEDMYIQEAGGYESLCISGELNGGYSDILTILENDVEKYGGDMVSCYDSRYSYCVSAQLTGSTTKYFCIDDQGSNIESTSNACSDINIACE
ncbi:type II secretion system GspH family protein [Patescibacteria group bacterium]|nr:type II secretion system GspH family protein [Patescibacteria group bacterium]MBU4162252.1 type II secretion system GspH family protein [Patescibacteria group bacterium]